MKNICLIGNSHAGPLYTAYKAMARPQPITFLSIPGGWFGGQGMFNIRREGTALTGFSKDPKAPGPNVDLGYYDLFIIAGGFPPPQQFINLSQATLSQQCREGAKADIGTDNHAMHVIKLIREVSDAPIKVLTNVYPLGQDRQSRTTYEQALGDIRGFLDPYKAQLLPQPSSTLTKNFFTRTALMISQEDRHLNAEGAQLVMADLFEDLAAA
jgi:hypothetical protein